MDAFISYVQKQSSNDNVIRIKLNLKEFESLKIGDNLYKYIDARYTAEKQNFCLLTRCNSATDSKRRAVWQVIICTTILPIRENICQTLSGTITTTVYTHYSDEFQLKEAEKVNYAGQG